LIRPGSRWYPRPGRRTGDGGAVQESLFDVVIRPEVRYYRQILDALERSGFPGPDNLEALTIVSKILGTVWSGQIRRDGEAEETFGLGLVDYARRRHSPAAEALLGMLGAVAPIREVRAAAETFVEPWPSPTLGRCWTFDDVYGDQATLVCEFSLGALVVLVDHARLSVATDALITTEVEPLIRDLTNDGRTSHGLLTLQQVEPDQAGAVLDRAFARTDHIPAVSVTPAYAELRALALSWLRLLPSSTFAPSVPADPAWIGTSFLASPQGRRELDPAMVQRVATFFARYEREPVPRVGPVRWEVFLDEWVGPVPATLPPVIRSFSEWAGHDKNLSDLAMAELMAVVDELIGSVAPGRTVRAFGR
jgi:hypothetical protein